MKYTMQAGLGFETLTPREFTDHLEKRDRALIDELRGIKWRRLPPMSGTVTGGGVVFGGDTGQPQVGPTQGNTWMIMQLAINGLASGTTPDILNMQIFGAGSSFNWWQFNGNNFSYTFSRFQLMMNPGEYLGFASQGVITAPANTQVQARGHLLQIPAEMVAKLL